MSGVIVLITENVFRKPPSPLCKTNIQPSRPSFIREQFSQGKKMGFKPRGYLGKSKGTLRSGTHRKQGKKT